jgi:uncharacterized protein (DUF58 family)
LTTRGQAFLGAGLTLIAAGVLLGLRDFTRFGVLIAGLPVLALLLDRRPIDLEVTRTVAPASVAVGDTALVQVTFRHKGQRSTPLLLVSEQFPQECGPAPRAALGSLAPGGARAIRYAVSPPLRGRLPLGPSTVVVRDPFGLTTRHLPIGRHDDLLVVPRTWPLEPVRAHRAAAGGEGDQLFVIAARGDEDQTVREYRDGDDRRRIHWPATARTGDLMVRHEDRPGRRRAVVLLDTRASVFGGGGGVSSRFEWALSCATSIALHLLSEGYAVTLVTAAGTIGGLDPESDADAILGHGATVMPTSHATLPLATAQARSLVGAAAVMVAVVGETHADGGADLADIRELLAVRPTGGDARAVVVTSTASSESSRRSRRSTRLGTELPSGASSPTEALLIQAGWATFVASPSDGIPEAWLALTRRRGHAQERP